ncbi:hypothetical protein PCANC_05920 [Puccinia coronata f. sp. avenae]|uniref:Lysophospholipase n=1 Tax=Puccinia coronata f. sp. avenae TaxID=200324 RepID=A0A2N5T304_9BASI|nr:hypothetical protein PCANC_09264 [Puccinia coronata f. sp. avenae]PLW54883.1 hypothetical protein PCANC_05920 [Puccinia coronata f. sp. avenae]
MLHLRQRIPLQYLHSLLLSLWIGASILLKAECSDFQLPHSPSGNYEPSRVRCPPGLRVRVADQYPWPISPGEYNYTSGKAKKSILQWESYLRQLRLQDFNITQFLESAVREGGAPGETLPNIAFATSGGGDRALLFSASMLDAFDLRNKEAVEARTGGILQLANYVTGLSAGAWLLTSWATANFERMPKLNSTVWGLNQQKGYLSWKLLRVLPKHILEALRKKMAGFDISFVDVWGRILSTQYIDDPEDGKGILFSAIKETPSYKAREFPLPILTSLSRRSSGELITLQSPIYEMTPEDFSVWHPGLNASIPMEYLGSQMSFGKGEAISCVKGFDNAGFLMGVSSNVFSFQDGSNQNPNLGEKFANALIKGKFYEALIPNPFYGQNSGLPSGSGGFVDSNSETLLLADGAMAQENLPLFPLLQPSRKVDVILAFDATVNGFAFDAPNVDGYPNGTALYKTYLKVQDPEFRNYPFPKIPNSLTNKFVAGGYNKRPTFFGCDKEDGPLIVYLPNYFASHRTDMRTMKTDFTGDEIDGFFKNSFLIATQKNRTTNNKRDQTIQEHLNAFDASRSIAAD